MKPLRLIFMGTPDFAVPALKALGKRGHTIVAVYTQPPRPAGRGMAEKKSPVHLWAEEMGVPVFTPKNFKNQDKITAFHDHGADFAVVAAYGLLLPGAILKAPKYGCINIHASLLPRGRGASPIQAAILTGDEVSGISIMQMEKGLDTGPVFLTKSIEISQGETAGTLHNRLAALAAGMIGPALEAIAGGLKASPQDDGKATYAPKISKNDSKIDWKKSATDIDRAVRAFAPFPGAWFYLGDKRIRILEGVATKGQGQPGEVLDATLTIACGKGAYRIGRLQKEGKKAMTAEEFLHGQTIAPGSLLG
ncbi:MAG: methionyl-tRNA formyltransferase [Sphingomonadales bacterium]